MITCPLVSVVIPFRNEEAHIQTCLQSLLDGGYPKNRIELILVDGQSDDESVQRIRSMDVAPATLKIIDNPDRIVPCGMNLGIAQALGELILWAGAHAVYMPGYIQHSVCLLTAMNAASVGGVIIPKGVSRTGQAIARAASNPFGVGNARYRYANKAGWVDTVFGGCFRKKDIVSIGGFNEAWAVNQDGEINYRLRTQIGGIYLSPDIRCEYFVRETYLALAKQYFRYGKWRTRTLFQHIGSFTLRQVVAPIFVLSLFATLTYSPVSLVPLAALLLIYFAAGFLFIHKQQKSRINIVWKIRILAAFMAMHLSWGVGFIVGVVATAGRRIVSIIK